jgi:heme A synthase
MLGLANIDAQVFSALYSAGDSVPVSLLYSIAEPSLYVILAWLVYAIARALRAKQHVRVRAYILALVAAVIARFGVTQAL